MSIFTLFLLLSLSGCFFGRANLESFLREDVDMSYISRIAVLPLENNSQDKYAAERVRNLVITQVLAMGLFDVVDKGVVDAVSKNETVTVGALPLDKAIMKRLGQRLGVQAFMIGTIDHAGKGRKGSSTYPEISMTLRLLDVNTGMIFWHASGTRNGDSFFRRIFGISSKDNFRVSRELVLELLYTLPAFNNLAPKPKEEPTAQKTNDNKTSNPDKPEIP